MSSTDTLLQQGIAAARAGQREEARALLMRVVQADERSEQGWLWLAGVVDDPDDMRTCLENVLELNPDNVKARQGLAWVDARHGPRTVPEPPPEPVEVPAQPPEEAPATGPTIRLAPEPDPAILPEPAPQLPQPAPQVQEVDAISISDAPRCPYCGAPTTPTQTSCTQCRHSLMIRAAPPEKRSAALTILAVLWGVSTALAVLVGLAVLALGLLAGSLLSGLARQAGSPGGAALTTAALIPAVIVLLFAGLFFAITRGLLRQARWAYIVSIIFTALGMLWAVANVLQGGAFLAGMPSIPRGQFAPGQARVIGSIGAIAGVVLFCTVIWQVLFAVLTVLSYRDFFGQPLRFLPTVEATDHMGHYNNGVAYKNRGMWYMAAKEWEAAVGKAPRDLNYLHALGLAYAQIKQSYPQSTQYLTGVRHLLLSRKDELFAKAPELERLNLL
jgi:tetratricopeptide (TPR) repeat protein